MAQRKTYTQKFRDDACKLVTEKKMSQVAVAKKMGVTTISLGRWLAKAKSPKKTAPKKAAPKKAIARKISRLSEKPIEVGGILGIEIQAKIDQLEEDLAALNKVKDLLRK